MDHLQLLSPRRLARALCAFLLGVLLAAVSLPALAAYQSRTEYYTTSDGGFVGWSGAEVCAQSTLPTTYVVDGWNGPACYVTSTLGQQYPTKYWAIGERSLCLYGGALTGGMCSGEPTCPAGQQFDTATSSCKEVVCAPGQVKNTITNECQPPCPAAGAAGGSDYTSPYTIHPPTICRGGCSLTVGGGFQIPSSTGTWYGVNGLVHTGEFCNGSAEGNGSGNQESYDEPGDPPPVTVTPEDDPPRCKAGECPGDVNGVYVCVPCGAAASDTKPVKTFDRKTETTKTGTPPNETTQTKTTDTVATHDGSGTVTSTTSTTTTTSGPNGTTTDKTTQEKKEPQESFCKDNPTSAFCKEGKWGGACGSFTCSGDAVQCALAREVHQRNCDMNAPNEYSNAAEKVGTGTETGEQYLQTEKEREGFDVQGKFASEIKASPIAAVCPAPRVVPLPDGNSLEISFDKPCEIASQLGAFVVAFAYLAAALIVLKSPGGV